MVNWRDVFVAAARIGLGWIFFWPFLDKAFGLGYATPSERAWIRGGSPTAGFLGNTEGWFDGFFQAMADSVLVEWLFLIGLLGIGLALILGIGMRIATASGALLLVLMYLAVLPFERTTGSARGDNNPFWDDHVMYAVFLGVLAFVDAGRPYGLGDWWQKQPVVQKHPWLQ